MDDSPFSPSAWDHDSSSCFTAVMAIRAFEVVCILLATLLFVFYTRIMIRSKNLHRNLRVMLIKISAVDLVLLYARAIDLPNFRGVYSELVGLDYVKSSVWLAASFGLVTLQGERIFTLLHSRCSPSRREESDEDEEGEREGGRRGRRSPFAAAATIALITEVLVVFAVQWSRYQGYVTKLTTVLITVGCSLSALVVIVLLAVCTFECERQVMAERFGDGEYDMGKRLKMQRMVQSARMLRVLVPIQALALLLSTATFTWIFGYVHPSFPRQFMLVYTIAYASVGPRTIAIMLIGLLLHPSPRAELHRLLPPSLSYEKAPTDSPSKGIGVLSSTGKQLSFEPHLEGQIYFSRYAEEWGKSS